jgi:hypothetical protein
MKRDKKTVLMELNAGGSLLSYVMHVSIGLKDLLRWKRRRAKSIE